MTQNKFTDRYQNLNNQQRQAVDTIEGPVLVIAGPGTGKTELLGVRAANILKQTDTPPESILCLTFTDAASANMRERIASIIGPEAYKITIHTFHSFGSEIMQRYSEYFSTAPELQPVSDLQQIEIITKILESLPTGYQLKSTHPEFGFTYMRDVTRLISDLKKNGITPTELQQIIQQSQTQLDTINQLVNSTFGEITRLAKSDTPKLRDLASAIQALQTDSDRDYALAVAAALSSAVLTAEVEESTKPISRWRQKNIYKTEDEQYQLKDTKRIELMNELIEVYQQYQAELYQQGLIDFDDMLIGLTSKLKEEPELQFTLQERFLYIMVDEFQDTNGVQLELLELITSNPVHEGRPNVLAVGDDDQAIYKFQGASATNMQEFMDLYRDPQIVTLTDNYRSVQPILDASQAVICQSSERFTDQFTDLNKLLTARSIEQAFNIKATKTRQAAEQYHYIAQQINTQLEDGEKPNEIAIIARNHKQLQDCSEVLSQYKINMHYDRQHDLLEQPLIQEITQILHCIHLLNINPSASQVIIAEIIHYPCWSIPTSDIWRLSLNAHQNRQHWLDVLLNDKLEAARALGKLLLGLSHAAAGEPVLLVLDKIIGNQAVAIDDQEVISPIKQHYFSQPTTELQTLNDLQAMYDAVRSHFQSKTAKITDLISFLALLNKHKLRLNAVTITESAENAVNLLTAHKAKGLEFKTVFLIDCVEDVWLKSRSYSKLKLPANLPIEPDSDNIDDALRLLFVAITRAKSNLYILSSDQDTKGKRTTPIPFLPQPEQTEPTVVKVPAVTRLSTPSSTQKQDISIEKLRELLTPRLASFRLSPTDLNSFLDLTYGGPEVFLQTKLLRFPQTKNPKSAYGTAAHAAIESAHRHYLQTSEWPSLERVIERFRNVLEGEQLSKQDLEQFYVFGQEKLKNFYQYCQNIIDQNTRPEVSFPQPVMLGNANLTGKIDRLHFDEENKTIQVVDYKTGSVLNSWEPRSATAKVKAWKYKNQLMFYKLLIENSSSLYQYEVTSGRLEFIDAEAGEPQFLELQYNEQELAEFKLLIEKVYGLITSLDLPQTSEYSASLTGIQEFITTIRESS